MKRATVQLESPVRKIEQSPSKEEVYVTTEDSRRILCKRVKHDSGLRGQVYSLLRQAVVELCRLFWLSSPSKVL
jgi:hypothetical protein